MSNWKKIVSVALALVMCFSLFACGSSTSKSAKDGGKVLRIYCWNEEFQTRFKDYYESKLPKDIQVEWVITPNQNNAYQNKLDEDLPKNAGSADPIDIFLIEADYALKYVDTDYTLNVLKDVGLTKDDVANQYQYTKDIASDSKGNLKAVSWQATPGLFAYRRSIAKAVLGSDDPATVQTYLSDWTKFDDVAAKMSAAGYRMLSGFDDAYRVFSNNSTSPWVDKDSVIRLDPNLQKWIDQTKAYTDKGYNNKTSLWDDKWAADQGPTGQVFGFFYSTWGINFTLLGYSLATAVDAGGKKEVGNGIFGDWAVCEGPQSFYWGGTWICAAANTDNISLVKDIMKTMTCDKDTMKKLTQDTEDFTNNKAAMEELAGSSYSSAFLGGQNHIALFAAAAPKINMKNLTPYDQGLNESLQTAMRDYFNGTVTYEQALGNFYKSAIEKYPNLKQPS
jgi:multiple sugar transport system substrate-binding protein